MIGIHKEDSFEQSKMNDQCKENELSYLKESFHGGYGNEIGVNIDKLNGHITKLKEELDIKFDKRTQIYQSFISLSETRQIFSKSFKQEEGTLHKKNKTISTVPEKTQDFCLPIKKIKSLEFILKPSNCLLENENLEPSNYLLENENIDNATEKDISNCQSLQQIKLNLEAYPLRIKQLEQKNNELMNKLNTKKKNSAIIQTLIERTEMTDDDDSFMENIEKKMDDTKAKGFEKIASELKEKERLLELKEKELFEKEEKLMSMYKENEIGGKSDMPDLYYPDNLNPNHHFRVRKEIQEKPKDLKGFSCKLCNIF